MDKILEEIKEERKSQDKTWGDQSWKSDSVWGNILSEENGEVAKNVLEHKSLMSLKTELIQVASVAVAWIEALDKRMKAAEIATQQKSERLKQQIENEG